MNKLLADVVTRYAHQNLVTIACGTTCAYLGDERNLREYLIADEVASRLRQEGHTVISYLIDDSLDPLTARQLRVAVNKDPLLMQQYEPWCGKPIAYLPDPWGCCESYAVHFEEALLRRLHTVDCHPTLVRAAKLYEHGVYTPYVRFVLEHSPEIWQFLREHCGSYTPEKLFWAICPDCGYIDETSTSYNGDQTTRVYCARCNKTVVVGFDTLKGKLNWKLDCAVRWNILDIDAEAFSTLYFGDNSSAYSVICALSQEFFEGRQAYPLRYNLVKMENRLGLTLLEALPGRVLRQMLVEQPASDLKLTPASVLTVASRHEVMPGLTYLDFIKQLLPVWLLTPDQLTHEQRELVTNGIAFKKHFLNSKVQLHLPKREHVEGEQPAVLAATHLLLEDLIDIREGSGSSWDLFRPTATRRINELGAAKAGVLRRLRRLVGQDQGLPAARFLFLLPLDYLKMLTLFVELYLASITPSIETIFDSPSSNHAP